MPDPTAMLQEFAKYLIYVEAQGRKPSEEDVDKFIEGFLDKLEVDSVVAYGDALAEHFQNAHSDLLEELRVKQDLKKDGLRTRLTDAIGAFTETYSV